MVPYISENAKIGTISQYTSLSSVYHNSNTPSYGKLISLQIQNFSKKLGENKGKWSLFEGFSEIRDHLKNFHIITKKKKCLHTLNGFSLLPMTIKLAMAVAHSSPVSASKAFPVSLSILFPG